MRTSIILLFVCSFQLIADNLDAQTTSIRLEANDVSVRQLISIIEDQTDFLVLFRNNDVDVERIVHLRRTSGNLLALLDETFRETDVSYELQNRYIVLSKRQAGVDAYRQAGGKRITGTVTDINGETIIGANIMEKGTANGTVTDVNGNFSLMVKDDAILQISFIGYITQEISELMGGGTPVIIKLLEDALALEEVVVVGYGVQKRASVTGSVASIQTKDLVNVKTANVTNALAGKLPGLRAVQRSGAPGDDAASIDIRGFGSALIIVDGVERSFDQIDANDIESISVLKDASASVYGFKGANGIILINTKKGQTGKPEINYTGYVGLQNITRYPEFMTGYEYALLQNEAQQNIGISAPYSPDELAAFKSGLGTVDWYEETIRSSIPQMYHNLNVSGGAEKVRYYFSIGTTAQDGIYKSDDYSFQRYNVRSNVNAEIVKGFAVDIQLSGRLDTRNKPYEAEPITRSLQMAKPIFPLYANNNPSYWQNAGDKGNPVHLSAIDNVGYQRRDRREFNSSLTFNWDIPWVRGLKAKALLAYDFLETFNRNWYREYYEYNYDASADVYNVTGSHTISELTVKSEKYFKPTQQYSLNYSNQFGNHDIGALLLWEMYNDRNDWVEAYRQFTVGAIDQIGAGDKVNLNNNGNAEVSAHEGLVGRLNYAFAQKYLAEVSFRYDGSYKFAPEKRWGFFPAVSLGWRISEESFFKNLLPVAENFKIRASYGKIGDEGDFAAYQYLTGYTYPSGNYVLGSGGLSNGAKDRGMPNVNLTWYESTISNVGFEASILSGLLSAEFDWFVRRRDGLLATRLLTLPTTFGQILPEENLNSDRTNGFEIVLGHRNSAGDFHYDIKANFSTTREYYGYVERAASTNMYDNWRNNTNDRYKSISWGRKVLGQFSSFEEILNAPVQDGNGNKSLLPGDLKFEDWNNDGIIDGKDDQPIGHSNVPRMYYGLNLSGQYRGLDLTLFFQGAAGHEVFTAGDFMDPFIQQGLGNGISLWMDRWHRVDPADPYSDWVAGYMPALRPTGFQPNRSNNTWTMQKASYLRLKTVELGYTLPDAWLKSVGIERLRVYVNGFNALTFSNTEGLMKYMDPENSEGSFRYYPQMKTVNFGINLSF
ncbi:MAG: TonB-dependent receptor [Tannerella sp.]|nr:TonB-dependent receptor [Tannerella sp.]